MIVKRFSTIFNLVLTSVMLSLLASCALPKLNPFAKSEDVSPLVPKNATQYVCDNNKSFYVRMLNNGNDAWLIYPDHEVNLPKADRENRYSSGLITLVISGAETTLNDGEKIAYTNCKPQPLDK
jgi:membrane-bound inhibitor of C-type lysozyme